MKSLKSSHTKDKIEAGCDEAGRGCLAGPVFASAVILPKKYKNKELRDSKKLTEEQRNRLAEVIKKDALYWAVAKCSPGEIDKYNILWASVRAMHKALKKLKQQPELILVDGNKFLPYKDIQHICVIKGDDKYLSIAAASVLAKVTRDNYMIKLDKKYPSYQWFSNKGYPTMAHREGIIQNGLTPEHRKSFKQIPDNPQLDMFKEIPKIKK